LASGIQGADLGLPPRTKNCKNRLRGYILLGQLYNKNYQFWRLWGLWSPYFKSHIGEIWRQGADLGLPPRTKFCKNRLRGCIRRYKNRLRECPFGTNIYQKLSLLAIFGAVAHVFNTETVEFDLSPHF